MVAPGARGTAKIPVEGRPCRAQAAAPDLGFEDLPPFPICSRAVGLSDSGKSRPATPGRCSEGPSPSWRTREQPVAGRATPEQPGLGIHYDPARQNSRPSHEEPPGASAWSPRCKHRTPVSPRSSCWYSPWRFSAAERKSAARSSTWWRMSSASPITPYTRLSIQGSCDGSPRSGPNAPAKLDATSCGRRRASWSVSQFALDPIARLRADSPGALALRLLRGRCDLVACRCSRA